jgi:transcriptional regulator with XRE-family HTH domain
LKQKRLSNEEVRKIQELKEQGKTQREIAQEIGISEAAISKSLTKENFPKLSSNPAPDFSSSESSNVIKAPVQFQKQEAIDDSDEEDEEDLDDYEEGGRGGQACFVYPLRF